MVQRRKATPKKKIDTTEVSTVGLRKGAHPTAPGGMREADLETELVDKHGWSEEDYADLSWGKKVEAVVEARQAAERNLERDAEEFKEAWGTEPPEEDDLDEDEDDLWADDTDDLDEDDDADFLPATEPEPEPAKKTKKNKKAKKSKADKKAKKSKKNKPTKEPVEDETPSVEEMFADLAEAADATAKRDAEAKAKSLLVLDDETYDYVFAGHAGAGPSSSSRWMSCTASLQASRAFLGTLTPNQQVEFARGSEAARQGTTAHAAGEAGALHMLGKITEDELDMTLLDLSIDPPPGEEYTPDMAEYVSEYTDLISQYATSRGADHVLIEQKVIATVPLDQEIYPGAFESYDVSGSGDFIALPTDDDPVLVVGDLKYGVGYEVEAEENSQARHYGLGALALLINDDGELITDVQTIRYYIIQPRLGGIRVWEESLDSLLDWRDEELSPALTRALYGIDRGGATYNPTDGNCQFCPARSNCGALAKQRLDQASELFDVMIESEAEGTEFPALETLDNERLATLLTQVSSLVDLKDSLKEEAQRRAHRGEEVPGYHLVSYSPSRSWEPEATDLLHPDNSDGEVLSAEMAKGLWTEPALISPTKAIAKLSTEMEGKTKKARDEAAAELLKSLITVPDKRPVLAPVTSNRAKWTEPAPEALFDDLGDE